ncbi:hypothetical protein [Metabacillus litoralis]|uniref:hypothetical protein n=1 Tax=Metabacillus litoralis TaxID=152268 RepID=UPI001CFEB600|nr:hypothetical protein [Metabacillus litoralis]
MKILSLTFVTLFTFMFNAGFTYALQSNPKHCLDFEITLEDWQEVNKIIPKKSIFTVIDIETAKSFTVQRRAGSRHADVQPLTSNDTKIMKDIYNGNWSWHRRAILIVTNNLLIPASMHGMPHGAGAINNGFPGHFCIHFSGSTTHRSGKSDLSHHLMILKAAGKYEDYIKELDAEQLLNVLLVTIKNNDKSLAKKVALSNKKIDEALRSIDKIETMSWSIKTTKKSNELLTTFPVDLKIYFKNKEAVKENISFTIIRTSPISSWKVNIDPLIKVINDNN